jgi:hypothetical protein
MRPPVLVAIALVLLASAARAAAAPRLHGIPTHVRSGTELRVTWAGLEPEAHEAELELSLAGGRWVRISPELDAREGGFTWRVPAGLAGPARLRLRYGGESFEAEGDVSMSFVLEAGDVASRVPVPELPEWWCLDRRTGRPPGSQVSGAASLHRAGSSLALSPGRDRVVRLAAAPVRRSPTRTSSVSRRDVPRPRVAGSRDYPLRI